MTAQPSQETVKPEPTTLLRLIIDAQNASFNSGAWQSEEKNGRYIDLLDESMRARKALIAEVQRIEAAATQRIGLLEHSVNQLTAILKAAGAPEFHDASDALQWAQNIADGNAEAHGVQGQIWDELQALAPWEESNDMPWEHEILCGVAGVRLKLSEQAAATQKLEAEKARLWQINRELNVFLDASAHTQTELDKANTALRSQLEGMTNLLHEAGTLCAYVKQHTNRYVENRQVPFDITGEGVNVIHETPTEDAKTASALLKKIQVALGIKPALTTQPQPAAGMEGEQSRPKIVCLCGSTRFHKQFVEHNYLETMAGNIVLSVGFYPHAVNEIHGEGVGITPKQKEDLDELHKRKIDLCDEVLVLNVGDYIGSSTRSEIEYAIAHKKPVRWLEERKSTP